LGPAYFAENLADNFTNEGILRSNTLPIHDICREFKLRESLFLLNHLQTVLVQALLSDTFCVNLPLRPAAVSIYFSFKNAIIQAIAMTYEQDN